MPHVSVWLSPSMLVIPFPAMSPRKPAETPRPWVVPPDEYATGAGRPRTGPRGRAVRELPRITLRAERVALDAWEAVLKRDDRPPYVVFREMVEHYAASRSKRG